jgi:hypothetical protein
VKVTADDIAQLLAGTPPRRVPDHVRKAAQGGGGGCVLPIFGLGFGTFGMIFVVVFFPWQFLDEWRVGASDRTTPGEIVRASESNMSLNDIKVWEYAFSYTADGGPPREGTCYTTGRHWTEGAAVTVRYVGANPDLACVEGARLSQGGLFGAFVIIFPLIGYGMVAWFVVSRGRMRRLLRDGLMTEVDIVSVDETNMKVNYQTVYRIVIQGPALQGGQPVTVKRVNKADVNLALKHAREKQPVFILHDPRNPSRVIFPEALITGA